MDILAALRWMYGTWDGFPADVIKNCFNHCLRQTGKANTDMETRINAEALQGMQRDATEHGVTFVQAGVNNRLKPAAAKEVVKLAVREQVARELTGIEPEAPSNADAEEQEDGQEIYSVLKRLKCLVISKATLERFGPLEHVCVKAFTQCQRDFPLLMHSSLKLITIEENFENK